MLDAALDLLAERSYSGTSIAAVAEAAGVSVGNVHRYFASKDELVSAAVPEERVDAILSAVTGLVSAIYSSLASTIAAVLRASKEPKGIEAGTGLVSPPSTTWAAPRPPAISSTPSRRGPTPTSSASSRGE
jgi:hypothetical protein